MNKFGTPAVILVLCHRFYFSYSIGHINLELGVQFIINKLSRLVRRKFVAVLLSALRHGGVWGSGNTVPHILNLRTRWKWVVNLTSLPLYRREKGPDAGFVWEWLDPRPVLESVGREWWIVLLGIESPFLGLPSRSLVTMSTGIFQKEPKWGCCLQKAFI